MRSISICFEKFITGWGGLGFGSGANVPMHGRPHPPPTGIGRELLVRGKAPLLLQWREFVYLTRAHTYTQYLTRTGREPSVRGKGPLLLQWREFVYLHVLRRAAPIAAVGVCIRERGEGGGGSRERERWGDKRETRGRGRERWREGEDGQRGPAHASSTSIKKKKSGGEDGWRDDGWTDSKTDRQG